MLFRSKHSGCERVGHAGTLDPFATGVLLVLIGRATRLSQRMMEQPKEYDAVITLGATTATDDPEAPPMSIANVKPPTDSAVATELRHFTGTVMQRPPDYSAMKIGGRRAYDLARQGKETPLAPRPVRIDQINLISYNWPTVNITVTCGRGTYIRAIARDLGQALGVGGYLSALRRTRIGPFTSESAIGLYDLLSGGIQKLASVLRPLDADL